MLICYSIGRLGPTRSIGPAIKSHLFHSVEHRATEVLRGMQMSCAPEKFCSENAQTISDKKPSRHCEHSLLNKAKVMLYVVAALGYSCSSIVCTALLQIGEEQGCTLNTPTVRKLVLLITLSRRGRVDD